MDWLTQKDNTLEFLKKYRWAMIILLAGIVLMLLPEGERQEKSPSVPVQTTPVPSTLQEELETLLTKVEGAGKVKVLLSEAVGEQVHYQTDDNQADTDTSSDTRSDTVIITSADRNQSGLVYRVDPPIYLGAIVLCQGADRAAVKLAIVDAVGTITGLSSDKISVLKMK